VQEGILPLIEVADLHGLERGAMAKAVDVASWRKATPREATEFYEQKSAVRGNILIVRTHLRPVDVYAYLRARFGTPNGFQNLLRRDDSDNWIHWDFVLRAEDVNVYIQGTSRDTHFMIAEAMSDQDWKNLILGLKRDFGRMGQAKSEMTRSFEKFVVFQNKFVTLADLCAEMHEAITDAPSEGMAKMPDLASKRAVKRWEAQERRRSKRVNDLYGNCLKLRLLTPIMAEAFINMVILVFCKDKVRNDPELYGAFIRLKLPERLAALSEHCDGFSRPIDLKSAIYGDFKRVMDKRNFAIHGNMDPVREQIETVYFEGTRPLFVDGGDNIGRLYEHLETIHTPQVVVADYEAVHLFLVEITDHLTDRHRIFFDQVITDPFPGYEVHKKRVTRILPNHNIRGVMPGMRYDDELDVSW